MIIKSFSEYLQNIEIEEKKPTLDLLVQWIKKIKENPATNNIERVIHHEIFLTKNKIGMYMLTGNGKSGKILLESLYNFALSYEQQKFSRWIHNTSPKDFC